MARRRPARGAARGGGGIPASRPARARVATGAAALGACTLLAVYPAWAAERFSGLLALAGALALVSLAAALLAGWAGGVASALVVLGAAYAAGVSLSGARDAVDAAAPLYGAGLLALAELAYWSLELRRGGREETSVLSLRAATLGALALLSVVLGAIVVAVTALPFGGGLAWDALGVTAAAATLAILALLRRRGGWTDE